MRGEPGQGGLNRRIACGFANPGDGAALPGKNGRGAAQLDYYYDFYRGGAGFALLVAGLVFLTERRASRVRRANGALNLAIGLAFCLSALDPLMRLPIDPGNAIIANLMLVIGLAFYDMALFVFGGQKRRGQARRVFVAGAVWTQLVWLLPLADWLLALGPVAVSVEDGNPLGPCHRLAMNLLYAWPVAAFGLSVLHSRWRLSDLPGHAGDSRYLRWAAYLLGFLLLCLIASVAAGSVPLYRLGNVLLQSAMLAWYWLMVRKPHILRRIRREVHDNRVKRQSLDRAEAAFIDPRIEALVRAELFRTADISLSRLARHLDLPAYRLSRYFNEYLETSFPVWLNRLRVEWICREMIRQPEAALMDLAARAGYGARTTFTEQFVRLKGVNPGEYRRNIGGGQPG
jgi:AraC-like DNA-binding protein